MYPTMADNKLIASVAIVCIVLVGSSGATYLPEDSATALAKYGEFSQDESGLFKVCLLQEVLHEEAVRLVAEEAASVLFDDVEVIKQYVREEMQPVYLPEELSTNICPQPCRNKIDLPKAKLDKAAAKAKAAELCKKFLAYEHFCAFAANHNIHSDGPLRDWFCDVSRFYSRRRPKLNTLLVEAGSSFPSCDARMPEFNQYRKEFADKYEKMTPEEVKKARAQDDARIATEEAAIKVALVPIVERINAQVNALLPSYTECAQDLGAEWFKNAIYERDGTPEEMIKDPVHHRVGKGLDKKEKAQAKKADIKHYLQFMLGI